MAIQKNQPVKILAKHLAGLAARVLFPAGPGEFICVITDENHPSGHSARGAVFCLPETELQVTGQAPAAVSASVPAAGGPLPAIEKLG